MKKIKKKYTKYARLGDILLTYRPNTFVSKIIANVTPTSTLIFDETCINITNTIINAWNSQNPNKIINMPYRFNSYKELIEFREKMYK